MNAGAAEVARVFLNRADDSSALSLSLQVEGMSDEEFAILQSELKVSAATVTPRGYFNMNWFIVFGSGNPDRILELLQKLIAQVKTDISGRGRGLWF